MSEIAARLVSDLNFEPAPEPYRAATALPRFACFPTVCLVNPPFRAAGLRVSEVAILAALLALARPARQGDGADVWIAVSRRQIRRAAYLADSSSTKARVVPALQRLCDPIGPHPPVIVEANTDDIRRPRLKINGWWLPGPGRFRMVRLPLPMDGQLSLALYLFVAGIDTRPGKPVGIQLADLCCRLGIPTRRPSHMRREIAAALAIVNRHRKAQFGARPLQLKENANGQINIATRTPPRKAEAQGRQARRQA